MGEKRLFDHRGGISTEGSLLRETGVLLVLKMLSLSQMLLPCTPVTLPLPSLPESSVELLV